MHIFRKNSIFAPQIKIKTFINSQKCNIMKSCKDYRNQAWSALHLQWNEAALTMFFITAIAVLFNMPAPFLQVFGYPQSLYFATSGICLVVSIFLIAPLQWANENAFLDLNRDPETHIFPATWRNFIHDFATLVPVYVLTFLVLFFVGIFTLMIGTLILALAYSLVPFVIHDNPQLSPFEAMRQSRVMMRGHKAQLFLLYFSFIGWILLGCLSFGLAFFWIQPYICATVAAFYEDVKAEQV